MSRLSATMALAPPGPRSLAIVVDKCARSTNRSFMDVKGRGGCVQEQDCLSYRFQVIITNSPPTGVYIFYTLSSLASKACDASRISGILLVTTSQMISVSSAK